MRTNHEAQLEFPVAEAKIGHNLPPIDDVLEEWTNPLQLRTTVLIEQAEQATVDSEESADRTLLLAGMISDHVALIEKERTVAKEPYLAGGRAIDNRYGGIKSQLAIYNSKGKVVAGPLFNLTQLVDAYRREQDRIKEEERRRAQEELRRKREELEAAERERVRRQNEAAAAARKKQSEEDEAKAREARRLQEIEDAERQVEIEKLERQVAAPVEPTVLRNPYGVSGHRRAVYRVEITDLTAALRHARKLNEASLKAAVQQIYEAQVRAGVRNLPGATVTADSATTIRRR